MVGLPWSQHVAFLDDRKLTPPDPRATSSSRCASSAIIRRSSHVRARQRDSAERRPLARPAARRAVPAPSLRTPPRRVAPETPVHLRQLSADRVSRSLVLRRLRVQRLPASRAGAARLPRAPAAHRRTQAAAARRSGRRQHPRRRDGQAAITAMHVRAAFEEGRVRRDRVRVDRRMVARRPSRSTTGRSASSIAIASPSRRPPRSPRAFADAPFPPERERTLAARVGRRLRLQRGRHARRLPDVARAADLSALRRSSSSTTARGIAPARSAAHTRASASSTRRTAVSAPRATSASREATGEIVAYTDADTRVDPRLADVPRSAVPDLRRRRLGRPERRARRRSADGAVHRARARRPDARAARRSHRRARARLQHGVPPRRAAGDRRLQPDLPARRRRCGRVLAAAGARLEDRLRRGGARLASPSLVDQGLLAAAGRLRRGRDAG